MQLKQGTQVTSVLKSMTNQEREAIAFGSRKRLASPDGSENSAAKKRKRAEPAKKNNNDDDENGDMFAFF